MIKRNRRYLHIAFTVALLVVIASVCRDLNVDSILRSTTGIFLGLTRSTIYIGLFSAWGFSVRQRIVSQNVRRLLTAEAGLLVLWMLIRTVKYYFVADPNANRMLWYLYYIPMLFLPFLAVLISASIGKPEQARAPRWALPLALFTAILVGMVLTNDLHQFTFTFPEGTAVFTDEAYGYGTGYYFVIGWQILCALAALCIMLYKCRLPKSRKILWLPFIPTGIAVLYGVLYANGCGFIVKYAPDITVFQYLTFVAILESCIACGLIQSNTHYVELFSISDLPLYITDRDGGIWAASKESIELPQEIRKSTEEWPVMLKDNIRLSRSGISGGYILWADNVSEISNTIEELQDINKTLNERHTLIQEENRTNQQKAHLREANRLYHQMQMETAPQLGKMQTLIHAISKEDCREEERKLLAELTIIGAYFKRRNNLLFIAETQENIRLAELGYCFQESISALELQGVSGGCHIEGQGTVLLCESIRLYDLFESVLQETFSGLSAIAVFLRTTEDRCALCIQLHALEAKTFHFDPQFEVEQEEACDYLLTCSIERRGGGK